MWIPVDGIRGRVGRIARLVCPIFGRECVIIDGTLLNTDALLVAGVKAGEEEAFTAVVERYQGAIGRYLLRLVGDLGLAEDLCQETFFRAYRAILKTDEDLALKPWLYRIATNAAYSALRRRRPVSLSLEQLDYRARSGSRGHLERRAAQRELVGRALLELAPDYRVPLLLSAVEGFGYREIAEILGLSAAATRKRIYRAKQQFRAIYLALDEG
jgi:RNA polymerase sigma-70 factor (ECF subfamily)